MRRAAFIMLFLVACSGAPFEPGTAPFPSPTSTLCDEDPTRPGCPSYPGPSGDALPPLSPGVSPEPDDICDVYPDLSRCTEPTSTPVHEPPGTRYYWRSFFGDEWPFTVDSGLLICELKLGPSGEQDQAAVYFRPDADVRYAVNGTARTQGDAPDVEPIWADDPENPGLKKSMGPIIDSGINLCDELR